MPLLRLTSGYIIQGVSLNSARWLLLTFTPNLLHGGSPVVPGESMCGGRELGDVKITKQVINALKPTGKEYFLWDRDLIGFGVRVRESGAASYVIKYRAGVGRVAPTRRLTIGAIDEGLTPDEARRIAKVKLGEVATGGDPAADRAAKRAEMTVAALIDLYLEEGCTLKKVSTLYTDRGRLNRHVKPLLGRKLLSEVKHADIERFLRDVAAGKTAVDERTKKQGRAIVSGGKGTATRTLAVLSTAFSFAVRRGLMATNPTIGVDRYPVQKSERFLTNEELARLGDAIREAETDGIEWQVDEERAARPTAKHAPSRPENRRTIISPHAAGAVRLLILTGARLREILHLEWRHIDFERGLLFLADSKTGKKTIVLNGPAVAVLEGLPRVGRFVIAGASAGSKNEKPRSDLKRPWELISQRAGLDGVRLHDLRHTFASVGAGGGMGLPIVGKLLGHTQASTTQKYAHLDNDPVRRASERIGSDIARAMGDSDTTKSGQ